MTSPADRIDAAALMLLDEAFDAPAAERRAIILGKTKDNLALRERAMALFDAAIDDGAPITGGGLRLLDETLAPDCIGNYRIEREIGRGGMGAVYLGRRMTGDFDHLAAIKLVRMTGRTKVLSDRLRSERRLLAQLKHPNIAQLHDGGETDGGAPYFIMEYVDGEPLYDYLRTHEPDLSLRLKIFSEICGAIAYAHRNLVVHRDLSPANVLVSKEGQVKLIDFGISHTIGEDADQNGPRLTMTRGYTAPERMRGEATTTLSDIYSLGVMLKELIADISGARKGDIAAIAEKARAAEPEGRYQSVEALLDDLERYRLGRPVSAVGGHWLYGARRFIQRRKFAVSAAALAVFGVIATSVITTVLYLRADRAEKDAVEKFEAVRSLAKFMLFDLHDEIEKTPGTTRAREMLADTGRAYLDALSRTQGAPRALKMETAIGYKRLGDVLGNATGGNLGRRSEAGEMLQISYEQLAALKKEAPDDPDILRAFGEAAYALAVYHFVIADESAFAIARAEESEAAYRALIASPHAQPSDQLGVARAQSEQAMALVWMNRGEEAIALLTAAQARIEDLLAADPANDALLRERAQVAVDLGDTISRHVEQQGGDDYRTAFVAADDGVSRFRILRASGKSDFSLTRSYIAALWKRALILYSMEKDEESLADLSEAESILRPLIERDPNDLGLFRISLSILSQRALSERYLGRLDAAAATARENIEGRRKLLELEPKNDALRRDFAGSLVTLGEALLDSGDEAGACESFMEARSYIEGLSSADEENAYYNSTTGKAVIDSAAKCGAQPLTE